MIPITDEQCRQLLRDEYLFLQQTYEDFDKRALTIKNWAVTVCFVGIGLGFQYKTPALWLLSAAGALLFWLVEARWKTAQYAHALRIRLIEGHFRGDEDKQWLAPLQIYNSWYRAYAFDDKPHAGQANEKRRTPWQRTLSNARIPFVRTPYMHIFIGSMLLFVAHFLYRWMPVSPSLRQWARYLLAW